LRLATPFGRSAISRSKLTESNLSDELLLEKMIDSRLLSEEWMLIGRQEPTGHGGRMDLVALAPDASLVLIELKRDKTPREVVAQAFDYAAWVEKLEVRGGYLRQKSLNRVGASSA
jgi:RecB family endonuclease NucS